MLSNIQFRTKKLVFLLVVFCSSCVQPLSQNNVIPNLLQILYLTYVPTWSVTSNPSTLGDVPTNLTVDATHVYTTGVDILVSTGDAQIRIEKRSIEDGSLDNTFGVGGVVVSNIVVGLGKFDIGTAIKVDDHYVYIGGQNSLFAPSVWHLEKRNKTTGALITSFGSPNGYITTTAGTMEDIIHSIALSDTSIYIIGKKSIAIGDYASYIVKVDKLTGIQDPSFNGGGAFSIDPTTNNDMGFDILVDGFNIYLAGFESITASNTKGRLDKGDVNGNSTTSFGSAGTVFIEDSVNAESITTIAVDETFIYTGGTNGEVGAVDWQWQINKYFKSNGALAISFASFGSIKINPTTSKDLLTQIAVGAQNIYVAGRLNDAVTSIWQVRAYNKVTGMPDNRFGISGVLTLDPGGTGPHEFHKGMVIDSKALYLAGGDNSQGNMQWKIEKRRLSDGGL